MACLAPDVSLEEAIKTSLAFTGIYVGVLYLPINSGPRNAPVTITARLITLAILTILLEFYTRNRLPSVSYNHSVISRVLATAVGSGLTLMLYVGHILAIPVANLATHVSAESRFQALRNYIFAPLFEELVFRRQSLLIWSCQPPIWRLVFPALVFSMAHAHHARSLGMVAVAFQLAYTFLFGVHAAALYINTLSVCAPVAAHIVCNVLELPDFMAISSHRKRSLIYVAYVVSLFCFAFGFLPLTRIVRPRQIAFK